MNLTKKTMTAIFLVMITLGTSAFVYSQDWPMFGHDPPNTGYSSSDGPSTGDLQWVYTTEGNVESSPAVVDGKVYIGSTDGKLYCLNADTGASIWNYTTGGGITSSPAVADNKVYIASYDGNVYCLNADTGALIWNTQLVFLTAFGVNPTSPAVADEKVVIGSENGQVWFLDADNGDIDYVWEQIPPVVSPIYASPAVADGKVYIPLYDGSVRVTGYFPGTGQGGYLVGFDIMSSPAVADGILYIGSGDNKVYCFDTDPGPDPDAPIFLWDFQTGDDITSSPAVADGEVYISSTDGKVYCLDAYTGAKIWQYQAGLFMTSSPAVADNRVYIGGGDGKLYCLNADTGALIWDYFIGDDIMSSPAVADGKVYIASYGGNVYCFGSTLDERIASLEAENAATWIKFVLLPGDRINIYSQADYAVSSKDTTHVWHGFRSTDQGPWSELTEEQQTEFLSTAKWHFFVNDEEVSLDHVFRYDDKNDVMWSIFYRVFPPGYFEENRNNKLVGEWIAMEDGIWYPTTRTASLRAK